MQLKLGRLFFGLNSFCAGGEAEDRRHDRAGENPLFCWMTGVLQFKLSTHEELSGAFIMHTEGLGPQVTPSTDHVCFIDSHHLDVAHTTSMSWHILETHLSAVTKQVLFPPPWNIIGETGTHVVKAKTYRESITTSEATKEKDRRPLYLLPFGS